MPEPTPRHPQSSCSAPLQAINRSRSWWGWGYEDQAIGADGRAALAGILSHRFGGDVRIEEQEPPTLGTVEITEGRISPPASLGTLFSADTYDRASHTHGKGFADVVRAFHGDFTSAPDLVAYPADASGVAQVLEWAQQEEVAVIPFGGGSSVVGGVRCEVGDGYQGTVSLDLTRMNTVVEVDRLSRSALVEAGAFGPALDEQLADHGLTLRHYPQSYEHSTLGGWIATRSGGHFATNYTHIDDFVESMEVVTPSGTVITRRLPGSGAGPSPDRLFLGSEGILGVITRAWMRVQDRPTFRASAAVHFPTFANGVAAVRSISQSALFPANCRLIDPEEAALTSGVTGGNALLVLGFESADHDMSPWLDVALEHCKAHRGEIPEGVKILQKTKNEDSARGSGAARPGSADTWKSSFFAAPYWRDAIVSLGCIAETFETAVTWDRFDELYDAVMNAVGKALVDVCRSGTITCRFTHVYPDGPAPYFTINAPSNHTSQIAQWNEIKHAASEAILDHGGTITHHHSVGRDHRPYYDRQRPDLFADALRAAKRNLDPYAVLNPGVLIDPWKRGGSK